MRSFKEHLLEELTYEQYCSSLSMINEDISWSGAIGAIKNVIVEISEQFGIGVEALISAFKQKNMFLLLKAVSFNIKVIGKAIVEFLNLWKEGVESVFETLEKNKVFEKLKSGAMKIDEVVGQYPILAKISGIALAGLLLIVWLHKTHLGNPVQDFDLSFITDALKEKLTFQEAFASIDGLESAVMLALHATTGFSVHWFEGTLLNIAVALAFTAFKAIPNKDKMAMAAYSKLKSYFT